eukprot:gene2630-2874_t
MTASLCLFLIYSTVVVKSSNLAYEDHRREELLDEVVSEVSDGLLRAEGLHSLVRGLRQPDTLVDNMLQVLLDPKNDYLKRSLDNPKLMKAAASQQVLQPALRAQREAMHQIVEDPSSFRTLADSVSQSSEVQEQMQRLTMTLADNPHLIEATRTFDQVIDSKHMKTTSSLLDKARLHSEVR